MQRLERGNYTEQEVIDVLHAKYGSRNVKFRYDLLGKDDIKKGELMRVLSGEVSMSAFSKIKRTASFLLEDETVSSKSYFTWNNFGGQNWSDL